MRTIIIGVLTLLSVESQAQEIRGRVSDEQGKPITNATISLYKEGELKAIDVTNAKGDYNLTTSRGNYDLVAYYSCANTLFNCRDSVTIIGIDIQYGQRITQDVVLSTNIIAPKNVVTIYKKPLKDGVISSRSVLLTDEVAPSPIFEQLYEVADPQGGLRQSKRIIESPVYVVDCEPSVPQLMPVMPLQFINYHSDYILFRDGLMQLPTNDIRDALSLLPGVYQSRRGDDVHILGAREEGTLYIVDGIQLCRR